MAAGVHGGNLGRWFEQLCRIRYPQIKQIVAFNLKMLKAGLLPHEGGVYAFWWVGSHDMLKTDACNRKLELHGPGGRRVLLEIDDEWLGLDTDLPIPLYVGKSAGSLAKRVGQHLRLSAKRMLLPPSKDNVEAKATRPTTSCQLRAGVEHFFPDEQDTRMLVLENVGLSYVKLDGDEHAANRFYLEDLAIGLMRPPLNVDIER